MRAGGIDLVSQEFKRDPLPTCARLRAAGPIVRTKLPLIGEAWLATTYEAVTSLLKNSTDFVQEPRNAGRRSIAGLKWWMPRTLRLIAADNMLMRDEPDHRRLRKLVDQAFRRSDVEHLRERIRDIAASLLEPFAGRQQIELMADFARPFPLAVISELLGIPAEDRPRILRWARGLTAATSPLGIARAAPALSKLMKYLQAQFQRCRRQPDAGLMSALVAVEEAGDRLSEDELLAMVFLLFVAGHETTVHLISGGMLALLEHPESRADLAADWSKVATATDELLRFVTPVQMTKPRHARIDMELYDERVKRGEYFLALLVSANSDPDVFDAPEELRLDRHPNPHVAFGRGIHSCLGLQLARAEAEIAFEEIFTRFPALRPAIDESEIRYVPKKLGMRALVELPLALGP